MAQIRGEEAVDAGQRVGCVIGAEAGGVVGILEGMAGQRIDFEQYVMERSQTRQNKTINCANGAPNEFCLN